MNMCWKLWIVSLAIGITGCSTTPNQVNHTENNRLLKTVSMPHWDVMFPETLEPQRERITQKIHPPKPMPSIQPLSQPLSSGYAVKITTYTPGQSVTPLMDRLQKEGINTYFYPMLLKNKGLVQTVVTKSFLEKIQANQLKDTIRSLGFKEAELLYLKKTD